MAAYALGAYNVRRARFFVEIDSLMSAVLTRNRASAAANALLAVDCREYYRFAV